MEEKKEMRWKLLKNYKKYLEDPVYFIEHYCLINGKHIKLKDYQKKFIKWINQLKLEKES